MWPQLLSSWARDLVVVVGLAVIVEMLLPRGSFRRFGHLVMGLFVLLAMVKPMIAMLDVVVALPGGNVTAARVGQSYVWQPATGGGGSTPPATSAPAVTGGSLSLASLLQSQIARTVAWGLGLDSREVAVDVWLADERGSWVSRPERIRIRLARLPAEATAGAVDADAVAAARVMLAEALGAQIGAMYRLEPRQVEVILPR